MIFKFNIKLILPALVFILLSVPLKAEVITDEAQKIYKANQDNVYQIRVINKATGKKSSIGSGFQFTPNGYIATNYHVISQALNTPQKSRVEYIRLDGSTGALEIVDVDVIHDLAILKADKAFPSFFKLSTDKLSKGTRIYSMGNPRDLGMTIVEGIYNGLMEYSPYQKILFSGSLNPGMSGGPALNHQGKVLGVNVSTAGNQLSFLVPVEYLEKLYQRVLENPYPPQGGWKANVQKQLIDYQNKYFSNLLSRPWPEHHIGETIVPGEFSDVFKCWGQSRDKSKELYQYAYLHCSSEDDIFLSSDLYTGKIVYKYNWVTSKTANPFRFYHAYQYFYSFLDDYSNGQEDDVRNFQCQNNFIDIKGHDFKVILCTRQYKNYSQLFDMNLSLASVDHSLKGLLVKVIGLGLTKENIHLFSKRFMESVQWQP